MPPEEATDPATAMAQMEPPPAAGDTLAAHLCLASTEHFCCDVIFCQHGGKFSRADKLINQVNPERSND